MKKPRWKHIRWIILALLLAGVCMFRFISGAGEFYACCIYPAVSGCLSRLASLVSFSLCEALVVATVVALLLYPIIARLRAEILKKLFSIEYLNLNKKNQIITPTLKGELGVLTVGLLDFLTDKNLLEQG